MQVPNLDWAHDLFAGNERACRDHDDATGVDGVPSSVDRLWPDMAGCWSHATAVTGEARVGTH
jgi:hypothetical protein